MEEREVNKNEEIKNQDMPVDERGTGKEIDKELIEKKIKLENNFKSGANWFYWIAGLSLINSIIVMMGGEWSFIVGLGATQIIDALGKMMGENGKFISFGIDIIIMGVFVLFGFLCNKKYKWAFVIGMVLYALDGLLFLLIPDILSIGFHILVLFFIFSGLKASKELSELERQEIKM